MSQNSSQDSTRCVVAYDQIKGTILAVHFLPPGGFPTELTEEHLLEMTRSHASTRSGVHPDSIATLITDAAEFMPGTRLRVEPTTRQLLKSATEGHAGFAGGMGSSAN